MEVVPVWYDPEHYAKDGGSVFCKSTSPEDAELLIRLTPNLLSTRRGGFKPDNTSRQRLRLHFSTLPLPPKGVGVIQEVPTIDQLAKLLAQKP